MANSMIRTIATADAPQAIGPYSQAIAIGSGLPLLFVSGQLPIDPATGRLIEGDIKAQTRQILNNIEAILQAGGSSRESVVKVEIFTTNLADFAAINAEYGSFFSSNCKPARQTVQVAALPMNATLEISCIAVIQRLDLSKH
jgi:2-iminobutanoate/2-iminopropanoate deaminase